MTVLEQIRAGLDGGRAAYEDIMRGLPAMDTAGSENTEDTAGSGSELVLGDNTEYMKELLARGSAGRFKLIYIDPPFFTRSKFNAAVTVKDSAGGSHRVRHLAFDDRFERSLECYIENMALRILMMRDLLADDGLMWIHLDWHSVHYVKVILDELMGEKNFVNEIVWCYKSGGSGKRHFSRKHDTILVYGKTNKYYIDIPEEKSYNRGFKPYNFKGVKEYCDEQGWYTLVNMKDVWNVDMVGRTSAERTGYATQKPIELMKRIICAGSREGDLVGDFFCGSGSFLEAAECSGRVWAGCDNEKLAVSIARKRLAGAGADFACRYMEDVRSGRGRVDITVAETAQLENGCRLIKCSVTDFVPEIDTGYIQINDREYIDRAVSDDPVQLIDYIMIDDNYNGEFSMSEIIASDFGDISIIAGEQAAIVVVDVFGREYFAGMI